MKKAPKIPNDELRIAALKNLDILDTSPEEKFDCITELAAKITDCPIALISLVDENRQWFKSRFGLDAPETPRDISFCGHAIEHNEPFIISNAREDKNNSPRS